MSNKFFHQLRLLLWKNYIIKKRSLFVFVFELTVPLVLFLIMVAIRIKQHAKPVDIVYFDAWPLPSAGFVPVMQSFCNPENGVRNSNGFIEYPNSTAKDMLQQIEKILKSDWSSSWFQKTSAISPLIKNDLPTFNINYLSQKLNEIASLNQQLASMEMGHDSNEKKTKQSNYSESFLLINKSDSIDELTHKLSQFINFQASLDDLSKLSIHFPTGLCTSKKAEEIMREGDSIKNTRKTESLIGNGGGDDKNAMKKKLMKNYGFIGLWTNMQRTFCGVDTKVKNFSALNGLSNKTNQSESNEASFFDSIKLSQNQLSSLSLLFHVMYSNPVILYSPNTTLVTDNLIAKSNATFELIDRVNIFCRQWLNSSDTLVNNLLQTNQSLTDLNTFKKYDFVNVNDNTSSTNSDIFQLYKNMPNKTTQELIDQIRMIDSAACSWLSIMSGVNLNVFKGFASENDLVNYFLNNAYFDNVTVIASLVFNLKNTSTQHDKLDSHITYKIRQNASFTYTTKKIRERYWYPSPRDWDYYYYLFGFVWLQDLIDRAIIDYHSNRTVLEPGTYLHQMPYPCYMIDNFLQMIQHVMPLCLSISFVYTVSMLTQTIVYEKELRLKEVMKIMGLNNSVHLLAWLITYSLQFTLIMTIVTCILHFGKILTHSNPFLVFFILEIYAISTICFSFLVSSLYSKAKLAAACAGILYFLSYVPCMYISIREDVAYEIIPWWAKTLACMLSTSAFGIGSKYIAFFENDGAGIQWSNIDKSPLENDTYNCLNCVIIMIIDCFVYLILAWYIENVNPSYGIPLSWNYPFKASYWLGTTPTLKPSDLNDDSLKLLNKNDHNRYKLKNFLLKRVNCICEWFHIKNKPSFLSLTEEDQARLLRSRLNKSFLSVSFESVEADNDDGMNISNKTKRVTINKRSSSNGQNSNNKNLFEQEPLNLPIGVSIRNLTKKYNDSKLAVDNLSINFYESQITAFLGHNGAGKTTTISCLAGLIPATSGHALIYNKDIRTEINSIRNSLGMCPQHNILFDKLTVEEHLWFYAKMKHMNDSSIEDLIQNMLRDTGLTKKRNNLVNTLSGGMQRKLSVAIAFVGDANFVILDEPTAGVDPYARRAIWDLLLKYKQGRTIILSTHHMDEAELLGDRIAIISNGKLQCCGTSLFLKNALGEGNNLTIVKDLEAIERGLTKFEREYKFASQLNDSNNHEFENSNEMNDSSPSPPLITEMFNKKIKHDLIKFVQNYIPSAFLKEETLREYQFVIPLNERSNPSYWSLFKDLEENRQYLKINSYGIHDVSLEEIFIKAAQIKSEEEQKTNSAAVRPFKPKKVLSIKNPTLLVEQQQQESDDELLDINDNHSISYSVKSASNDGFSTMDHAVNFSSSSSYLDDDEDLSSIKDDFSKSSLYNLDYIYADLEKGYKLYFKQFIAIVTKRYLYNKRNWKSLLTQIILPACFICIAMTVALSAPGFLDLPELELSPAQFYPLTQPEGTFVPFSYDSSSSSNLQCQQVNDNNDQSANTSDIINTFSFLVGIGSTCVLNQENLTLYDLINYNYSLHSSANSNETSLLREKYFGNSDSCRIAFNKNADISFKYFSLKNSSLASKLGSRASSFFNSFNKEFKKKYFPQCICLKDNSGFECTSSYDQPASFRLITHETLLNISGANETEYYLYTTELFRLKRYGGLSFDNEKLSDSEKSCKTTNNQKENFTMVKKYQLIQNLIKNKIARVWYNNKGFHAMPTFLNVMNNALLRANVRTSMNTVKDDETNIDLDVATSKFGITVINHPMNQTNNYLSTEYLLQGSDVLISIFTIVAMSFVNASFVFFLVYERSIKSLHLQFLMGLNPFLYWLTNIIWDMFNYMLPASCVIIIFKIFDVPAYVQGSNYPAVILLFLFYGWSVSPLMYPLTFLFKEPSNAYIFLIVINLFTGITCVESSFLLQVFSLDSDLKVIYDILKIAFLVFPPYCLGRGLIDIAYNDYYNTFFAKTGQMDKIRSPFAWDITTRNLVAMACIGCVSWGFTLLLEYDFFKFKWLCYGSKRRKENGTTNLDESGIQYVNKKSKEDPDVYNERARIEEHFQKKDKIYTNLSDRLILRGIRKVYEKKRSVKILSDLWGSTKQLFSKLTNTKLECIEKKNKNHSNQFVAVKNLTLGVPEGECFGLLGVNGAGKTTTFKMLTTDLEQTNGNIFIMGNTKKQNEDEFISNQSSSKLFEENYLNSLTNKSQYWNQIGYCPQFDALYDELTPTDHIRLFARLKGVSTKYEETLCNCLLKRLDLIKYQDKPVGSLSLGNKRKLSVALSLVGNPMIVLLDEPTSGMDPVSRRHLWSEIINLIRDKHRSCLITSHSMEECENLCTRLAIMVDGQFKCMGSVQHLKTKFGDGYTLTVKIKEINKLMTNYTSTNEEDNDNEIIKSSRSEIGKSSNMARTSTASNQINASKNKYILLILKELREKISKECNLKERNFNNVYQFELPCPVISNTQNSSDEHEAKFNIGDVYRLIESNKLRFGVADYSLSQNTLDNVFINFVREQTTSKKQKNDSKRKSHTNASKGGQKNELASEDNNDDDEATNNNSDDDELVSANDSTSKASSEKNNHRKQNLNTIQFPLHDNDELLYN